MKPSLFLFTFLLVFFQLKSQELSIGQVFDFEIGDEFHFTRASQPPNATRFTVIGKYYSTNQDTVYYIEKFDSYTSRVVYNPNPHLEYELGNEIDTVYYTNLQASIASLFDHQSADSCDQFTDTTYVSEEYCQRKTYKYNSCLHCCFEGEQFDYQFVAGLGKAVISHEYPAENSSFSSRLFYYKKGGSSCGTPDKSNYTGIKNLVSETISINPNPACDYIYITGVERRLTVSILNSLGEIIESNLVVSNGGLALSELTDGLYLLCISDSERVRIEKVIISNYR